MQGACYSDVMLNGQGNDSRYKKGDPRAAHPVNHTGGDACASSARSPQQRLA